MNYKLFLMLIWLTGVAAVFGTLVTSNIIYGIGVAIVTITVTYYITRAQQRIKKKVKAEEKPPVTKNLAGFLIRAVAFFIDLLIFSILLNIIRYIFKLEMTGVVVGAILLAWGIYYTVLVLYFGNTIGKRILGLKIISATAKPITLWRIFIRALFLISLDGMFLGIGYWLILINENKQGLHDIIAHTYVIREDARK